MEQHKKRKRSGGNSKANPHANWICQVLSLWWDPNCSTKKLTDLLVRKTESSGGNWRTGGEAGDLINRSDAMKPFFDRFIIELKRGYSKDWNFCFLLKHKRQSTVYTFWQQVRVTASFVGKIPLMIYKPDRWPDVIVMEEEIFYWLRKWDNHNFFSIKIDGEKTLIGLHLVDFLSSVDKHMIINAQFPE
jgi:hypothetical protein